VHHRGPRHRRGTHLAGSGAGYRALHAGPAEQVRLTNEIERETARALTLAPDDDAALSIRGSMYRALGNAGWFAREMAGLLYGGLPPGGYPEAEEALLKAIALNPAVMRHHYELGVLYLDQDRIAEAEAALRRAAGPPRACGDRPAAAGEDPGPPLLHRGGFGPVTPPPDPCLLLYDAGCPLCRSAARFALSHTGVPPIRAIPLQSAEAAALLSSCRLPGDPDGTVVVMDDGKPYVRSEALLRIAARLPFPWRLLALARILPRRLRDPPTTRSPRAGTCCSAGLTGSREERDSESRGES